MKIGIFTDGYLPEVTGVATSVDALVTELERRGHSITLVAPKYPHYEDRRPVIRLRSVPLPSKKDLRVATYLPGAPIMMSSQLELDIIHGHAGGPVTMFGWEIAKIKRVPFVLTYHTLFSQYTHYILKGKVLRPKMVEVATKVFANTADGVIAPTAKIRDELLSYGVKKPIMVIPSGIDLSKFKPLKSSLLHQRTGLAADRQILLFVGRLGKEKSIDYLIRSFAIVARDLSEVDLVLVGDGPERTNLENLVKELGVERRVYFTGFIDPSQTPLAYSDATLLVFCSTTETQGLVIPEAMACGLPVVVVDDPAYHYIVQDGVNGLIAANGIEGFAAAIKEALSDPARLERLAKEAVATAAHYSLEASVDKVEGLYTTLLG